MQTSPSSPAVRRQILVRGVVQGVGFRPFVYRLAQATGLSGHIFNSSAGVTIEIEGPPSEVSRFTEELRRNPPPLASIAEIAIGELPAAGTTGFAILPSREEQGAFALVPPDMGTCEACWRDFGDPLNRRYGYPFTNCTVCGPRYTIIGEVPYDRATTTMAAFTMCAPCRAEYENPEDRRFHAQPNACPVCGPALSLAPSGVPLDNFSFNASESSAIIRTTRQLLHQGSIVAIKGLGGFLLACDATNDSSVAELRRRKQRPAKPFALMVRDLASARELCDLSPDDEAALTHQRRPIVILARRSNSPLSEAVAPGNNTLGIMLPYTPLHYLLFSDSPDAESEFTALVMTSGNRREEPIVVSNAEAITQLSSVADWLLLHNRNIAARVDDSVVRTYSGREHALRRSRGYTPQALDLGIQMEEVLAFGGELKNTFCLTKGHYAILSQHIGDLTNYETETFFNETQEKLARLFNVSPRIAAHDLHPQYRSTRMALASSIEHKIAVQHHHAHIASCMAENRLQGEVIGVALDGAGFGADGRIWGGEFMTASLAAFTRRAHLRYVPQPGGDASVKRPWRMALSYLRDTYGCRLPTGLTCLSNIPEKQLTLIDTMLARRFQAGDSSSCGRLFDAVAALLGFTGEVTFEGQAAIALEMQAAANIEDRYGFEIAAGEPAILDLRPTIAAIVHDIQSDQRTGVISARFHNTLSAAVVELCERIRAAEALNRVCLSGGTFQNLYLLHRTVVELQRCGFEVFLHALVPANDGGLSLGQAVIANELFRRGG